MMLEEAVVASCVAEMMNRDLWIDRLRVWEKKMAARYGGWCWRTN